MRLARLARMRVKLTDFEKKLTVLQQAVCVTTPQGFIGKTVTVPHFYRDTVEFASRKRDESNPGIKTLMPFLWP